ncbi:MAG: pepsin/retropepsin-like aspartic protease family protein [Terriglobia bacterium]
MQDWRRGSLGLAALLLSTGLAAKDLQRQVPFKLYHGYTVVAQGSIGDVRHLNFLIDTGAVPSVIDERLARRLRLSGEAEQLSVFNRTLQARRVIVPELQLGPVRAEALPVLVRDLSFVEDGIGVRVDGMIGLDVLKGENFTIDYETKKLLFGERDAFESSAALVAGPGYVAVQMLVNGQPVHLMVDTGAKDLILFGPMLRGRLPGARIEGAKQSENMSGAVPLKRVSLPATRLGNDELGSVTGFLMETLPAGLPGFDGLLGVTSLGARRVNFDFGTRTIRWEKRRR